MPAFDKGDGSTPFLGSSFERVDQIIEQLQQENSLEFQLPSYEQWFDAITANNTYELLIKGQYQSIIPRVLDRGSAENKHPLEINLTPRGLYEFCKAETPKRTSAYAPVYSHAGELHRESMHHRHYHSKATFRLVLSYLPAHLG
ncbi:hypothetical protein [Photobacterium kasasachensis]|uniref:hypothetical protein n=1 Tax=Photobacterium kasasachensis TaxID=2910240 RepID=UPI003D0D3D99